MDVKGSQIKFSLVQVKHGHISFVKTLELINVTPHKSCIEEMAQKKTDRYGISEGAWEAQDT